jgi:quercetin dioxygenase-like cupin family protein
LTPEEDLALAIFDAATALLGTAEPAVAAELRHMLAHRALPPPVPVTAHAAPSIQHHMPAVLASSWPVPFTGIAPALSACWQLLNWHYHYPDRPDLAANIGFAELIGPAGPLGSDKIRVGFTFMAPGIFYPLHDHPAVELYLVLSGHARWTRGTLTTGQDPGAAVLHASMEPHAMETATEPLLALYVWTGEIASPARYLPR